MSAAFSYKTTISPVPSFPRKRGSSAFGLRWISVFAGVTFLVLLSACSLPKSNPILEGSRLKGFEQSGPLTVYNRTNLFDYMNGEAEAYRPLGFHLLYVTLYGTQQTDSRMVLEIYDMGTREGAAGILKKYSGEGGPHLPGIGDAAWAEKGIVLFSHRNYFVRIYPDPSPENEVRPTMQEMLDLAREMVAAM